MIETFLRTLDTARLQEVYRTGVNDALHYVKTGIWLHGEIPDIPEEVEFYWGPSAFPSLTISRLEDITALDKAVLSKDTIKSIQLAIAAGVTAVINYLYPDIHAFFGFSPEFQNNNQLWIWLDKRFSLVDDEFEAKPTLVDYTYDQHGHGLNVIRTSHQQPNFEALLADVLDHLNSKATPPYDACTVCEQQEKNRVLHKVYEDDYVTRYVDEDGLSVSDFKIDLFGD